MPDVSWLGWLDVVLPQLFMMVAGCMVGVAALFCTQRWFAVHVVAQLGFVLLWLLVASPLFLGLELSGSGVRWILAAWYVEFRGHADDGNAYILQQLVMLTGLACTSYALAWLTSDQRHRVLGLAAVGAACLGASLWGPFRSNMPDYMGMDPIMYMVRSRFGLAEKWTQVASRPVPKGLHTLEQGGNRSNVVVVFLESVGANATQMGDGAIRTTPFLNALAADSVVGERTYVVTSSTYKAHVAALCGVEPYFNGDRELFEGAYDFRCLPELLGEQGYQTAYFTSSSREALDWPVLVDHLGFDEMYGYEDMPTEGFESSNSWAYEDAILLGPSQEWISKQETPFLASYMVCAPHFEYLPLSRYGQEDYHDDPTKNRYLNSVRYVDGFLEELIGSYEEAGVLDRTIFVIVGDHGESFGEHMPRQHNASPYEEVVRVPLLIYAPGLIEEGRQAPGLTSQLDITPTLLDLLQIPHDASKLQGSSLMGPTVHETVHTACLYNHTCATTIGTRWKYIHHFGEREDELFDLMEDPKEMRNVVRENPERAQVMGRETLRWYLYGEGAHNGPSQ